MTVLRTPHEVRPPAGHFFVAYLHGEAVGCGAVKQGPGAPTEIKRMWIAPAARGLGVGRRLLGELEACALAGGASAARIETSAVLTEALALFRSNGWVDVPPFNHKPFVDHWFENPLAWEQAVLGLVGPEARAAWLATATADAPPGRGSSPGGLALRALPGRRCGHAADGGISRPGMSTSCD